MLARASHPLTASGSNSISSFTSVRIGPVATLRSNTQARHSCQTKALQEPQQQQQQQQQQQGQQQQQQQEIRLPGRRYTQVWKAKRPLRKPRLLDAPRDPSDPWWGTTKRERRASLLQTLQQQYGPHASDRDVRLYLKKRSLNEARPRPSRRGGFPLDDSFDKPGTFLKLSADFQRTVLLERVSALSLTLTRLPPESIWQLYTTLPGLLTLTTLEVAQRLTGLSAATGLSTHDTLQYCCTFKPFAFMTPDTVMTRVSLLAKVARLECVAAAVVVMQQHPQLWGISSKLLALRVEQLSLLLHCCPLSSLKLIGSCPHLLSAPLADIQQQLAALSRIMGAGGQPERVVPLLLWRPGLLLLQDEQQPQGQAVSQAGRQLVQQQEQQQHHQQQEQHEQHQQEQRHEQQQGQPPVDPAAQATHQQHVQHQGQQQAGPAAVDAVAQSLQHLTGVLGLPVDLVQGLAIRAPDVLQLGAAGLAAVSAAAASLEGSWLLGAAAGLQQRQQHQRELLKLLQPQQYSKGIRRRKVGQGRVSTAAGWYTAVQAVAEEVRRCQWWADTQQQQQQLSGLQQLVLQAPGLLVLAAAHQAEAGVHQQQSAVAEANGAGGYSEPASVGAPAGLTDRLQLLCDELLLVLDRSNQYLEEQEEQQYQEQYQQQQQQQQQRRRQAWQGSPGNSRHQQLQQQHHLWWQQEQELAVALQKAAVLEPCILTRPPGWVAVQLQQLAGALQVPPSDMLLLFLAHPCLLWLTQDQIFDQIRVLCGVLRLPVREVKRLLTQADAAQLLLLHPEAVKKRFAAAAQAAGGDHHLRQLIRNQPSCFLNENVAAR